MKRALSKRSLSAWSLCCVLLVSCSSIEAATDNGGTPHDINLYDASDAQVGDWIQAEILHETSFDKDHPLTNVEETALGSERRIVLSPCDISQHQTHGEIAVMGTIAFLDGTNPNGLFLEVEDAGCHMGLWVEKSIWHAWDPAAQDLLRVDQEVILRGFLTTYPGELILEVNGSPLSP